MRASLSQRIAYHRSFSNAERWDRLKERLAIYLARRLPKRLRMWVIVCRHADVVAPNQHPDDVKAFDLTKGW